MGMKVSGLDFVRLLPAFMRDDEAAVALSKAMDQLMGDPGKRLNTIRTWDRIDELNEAECDELAWELDVDWYDSTGMSLQEKQATIKFAQQIKRKRGTKWAVERLINAYFGDGYVLEWYDMGENPYTFAALTTSTTRAKISFEKFMEAVNAAKNERSRMLGIFYYWPQGPELGVEYTLGSGLHRYNFKKCGISPKPATMGFVVKSAIETEPDTAFHRYTFKKCSETKPKTCIALNDIKTGERYSLYVSGGKLTMNKITGKATKNNIVLGDRATGDRYSLYVSGGKLTMEKTTEEATANILVFDDHMSGEKQYVYVAAGRLFMGMTEGKVTRNNIIFGDRATGDRYSLYVSGGKLTMGKTTEAATANNLVLENSATGDRYSLYVSAGKLTMEKTTKAATTDIIVFDDQMSGEIYLLYEAAGRLTMEMI